MVSPRLAARPVQRRREADRITWSCQRDVPTPQSQRRAIGGHKNFDASGVIHTPRGTWRQLRRELLFGFDNPIFPFILGDTS
jgi:hypothetical protein